MLNFHGGWKMKLTGSKVNISIKEIAFYLYFLLLSPPISRSTLTAFCDGQTRCWPALTFVSCAHFVSFWPYTENSVLSWPYNRNIFEVIECQKKKKFEVHGGVAYNAMLASGRQCVFPVILSFYSSSHAASLRITNFGIKLFYHRRTHIDKSHRKLHSEGCR